IYNLQSSVCNPASVFGVRRPRLILSVPERSKPRHRLERPAALVHGIANLRRGSSQALHVPDHLIEPRLGAVQQVLSALGEKQESKSGADGGADQYARKLRLLICHTASLKPRAGLESAAPAER